MIELYSYLIHPSKIQNVFANPSFGHDLPPRGVRLLCKKSEEMDLLADVVRCQGMKGANMVT